jgi:hypothetical protein
MNMRVGGPGNIVKNLGEQALEEATSRAPLNLFADDTMSGRRANIPGRTSATSGSGESGGRQDIGDILARMGASDSKKQAFDIGSDAISNIVKGGFKEAGSALSAISGAGDALGGIMKALGGLGGIISQVLPIVMAMF